MAINRNPGKSAAGRARAAKPTTKPNAKAGSRKSGSTKPSRAARKQMAQASSPAERAPHSAPARTSKPRPERAQPAARPASKPMSLREASAQTHTPAARPTKGRVARPRAEEREGQAPQGPKTANPRPKITKTFTPKAPGVKNPMSRVPGVKPAAKKAAVVAPAKPAPRNKGAADTGERLQKILAHAGVDSRRACEQLILEGKVQVNGVTVTELGAKADPRRDQITLNFEPIRREALVYILMNKPKGYVTTVKDEQGRPTVMALLGGVEERVYPVGRLDFNSEGLLLFTNDGEMAQRLSNPDSHIPKIYWVKVHRTVPPETLDEFREGFRLDGQRLKPVGIEVLDKQANPWLQVTLIEGKNRQIRKMFEAVGHPVHKLRRVQYGPLNDPGLKPGHWRFLTADEVALLKNL